MYDELAKSYHVMFEGMREPVFFGRYYPARGRLRGERAWESFWYARALKGETEGDREHLEGNREGYLRDLMDLVRRALSDFPGAPSRGIVAIPSSIRDRVNVVTRLVREVASRTPGLDDLTGCLVRGADKVTAHGGGDRTVEANESTLSLALPEGFDAGGLIVVVDDITTTGNSFVAVDEVLRAAGFGGTIVNFAFARTTSVEGLQSVWDDAGPGAGEPRRRDGRVDAIVLDLDQTLLDDPVLDREFERDPAGYLYQRHELPYVLYDGAGRLGRIDIPSAIVSNGRRSRTQTLLTSWELSEPLFGRRVGRGRLPDGAFLAPRSADDSHLLSKPCPDGVLEALEHLLPDEGRRRSARAVGLGNTYEDLVAYRAAGIESALALWGVPAWLRDRATEAWGADHVFLALDDFLDWCAGQRPAGLELDGLGTEAGPDAPTLTALIRGWRAEGDELAATLEGINAQKGNAILRDAGLIEKGEDGTWAPTACGSEVGIEASRREFRDGTGVVIVYAPRAALVARETILAALGAAPAARGSDIEGVLGCYRSFAETMGRERDRDDPDDSDEHPVFRQAGYSLLWFFSDLARPERLNDLSLAYLGDERARAGLRFGEADPSELGPALLEGRFPLNDSQRSAVARALESDLSLVQGPPGTGKTETILNMASCMLARGCTVAVVSNNRKAIENVAEKIEEWRRTGAKGPNQQRLIDALACLGSKAARVEWMGAQEGYPDADEDGRALRFFDRPASGERAPRGCRRHGIGGWEPRVRAEDFLARWPLVTSTIHSLKKCFADGEDYQYDYVIIDEASQCNPMLGLVAMSCARHLVVVGDQKQLPPIYSDRADRELRLGVERAGVPMLEGGPYALRDDETGSGMSLIGSLDRALLGLGVPHTLLNEHYRCHPGIIGFCNEYVYGPSGSPLVVRTPDYDRSVRVPIRVRWFEGIYCERYLMGDTSDDGAGGDDVPRSLTSSNARQVEVFMREEWPALLERLGDDERLSVCVLSPYRGVLDALGRRLDGERVRPDELEPDQHGGDPMAARDLPALTFRRSTIHKAQGQEFDIVYLLPGEDGAWEWPWTEGEPLINVAVSRAKRELVLIASSCLMGMDVQEGLVGPARAVAPRANRRGTMSEGERARREQGERFVRRLVDYVRARCPEGYPESPHAFGFHRSALRSVFDVVARRRDDGTDEESANEQVVREALEGIDLGARGLELVDGLPLSRCVDLAALDARLDEDEAERARAFVERDSHFDFALVERRTGRLALAIEVDGEQHRAPMKREKLSPELAAAGIRQRRANDRLKDEIALALGGRVLAGNERTTLLGCEVARPSFTLLRLPTDGTTALEFSAILGCAPASDDPFVTVEELLDDQLAHGLDRAPTVRG